MNCLTCQEKMEEYISGEISADIKIKVSIHLDSCEECRIAFTTMLAAEKFIEKETFIKPNPYLASKVMAAIDAKKYTHQSKTLSASRRVLHPIFISLSITTALLIGISIGNLYNNTTIPKDIPQELVYLDDAQLESLNLLIKE